MKKPRPNEGVKYDEEKPKYALIPVFPLHELARVYTFGANKYSARNWERGMDWSRVYSAVHRHLAAFWSGESIDPESGLPHLAHAAFGLFALMEYEQFKSGKDDRNKRCQEKPKP